MANALNFGLASGFAALGLNQYKNDVESTISASMQNLTNAIKIRNGQRTIFEAQAQAIDERLGYQLTQTDLTTLKAKARLKAGQAETGTSGGTSRLAVEQAYVIGAKNREAVILNAKDSKLEVARRNIMSRLDSEQKINSAIQDIPTADEITYNMINTAIAGISSGWKLGTNLTTGYESKLTADKLKNQNSILGGIANSSNSYNKYNGQIRE